jgi:hypothetical protein
MDFRDMVTSHVRNTQSKTEVRTMLFGVTSTYTRTRNAFAENRETYLAARGRSSPIVDVKIGWKRYPVTVINGIARDKLGEYEPIEFDEGHLHAAEAQNQYYGFFALPTGNVELRVIADPKTKQYRSFMNGTRWDFDFQIGFGEFKMRGNVNV